MVSTELDDCGNLIESKKKPNEGKHVDQTGEKVVYKSLL